MPAHQGAVARTRVARRFVVFGRADSVPSQLQIVWPAEKTEEDLLGTAVPSAKWMHLVHVCVGVSKVLSNSLNVSAYCITNCCSEICDGLCSFGANPFERSEPSFPLLAFQRLSGPSCSPTGPIRDNALVQFIRTDLAADELRALDTVEFRRFASLESRDGRGNVHKVLPPLPGQVFEGSGCHDLSISYSSRFP